MDYHDVQVGLAGVYVKQLSELPLETDELTSRIAFIDLVTRYLLNILYYAKLYYKHRN